MSSIGERVQKYHLATADAQLVIHGQADDGAPALDNASEGISFRAVTDAQVLCSPPAWPDKDEAGERQRTPDIAAVIQQIVDRSQWSSGNSLALIITGAGKRTAEAYNGDASGAPMLYVEFQAP